MAAANAHPFPALHLQQAAKAFSSDRITPVSNTSRLRLIRDASLWGLNPYRVFLHESGQYPTFYRRHKVTPGHQQPRPTPARALCDSEREHVLNVLASPRFVDRAPAEVVATLLDEGQHLCSQRTMYRILAANQPVRERRNQLDHPRYTKPELVATGPNETWSWDITRLLGPTRWTYFYLYVLLDIFSRYVVGWMVAERENAALAFCRSFFPWYNTEHRHGGIAMLTPDDVHHGRAHTVLQQREQTLRAAWNHHPERFVRGIPKPLPIPEAVWINPPATSTTGETAQ